MASTSTLENIVKSILGVGNKEANQQWPPYIIDAQFNTVTGFLISRLVESYPIGQDILRPFIKTEKIPAKNGYVTLPEDYRNKLGAGISVKKDSSGECDEIQTAQTFKSDELKGGCKSKFIEFLPESEWDDRTSSTYKFPTFDAPIACFFGADKFKVCPYNIGVVELRYVRKEKQVKYGYILQPDDTFIYDVNTSEESEWENASFDKLFTGMFVLYSAYLRDNTLMDWSVLLKEKKIF